MRTVRDDDERDGIIEDGRSMRVPLLLKDSLRNQPGYLDVPNSAVVRDARAAARAARETWIRDMTTAWKRGPVSAGSVVGSLDNGPEPDAAGALLRRHLGGEPDADDAARAERIRARTRAEYLDRLQNAWRTNPQAATAIERQGERWRGGR